MTKRSSIAKFGSIWSAFVVAVVAIAACFGPRAAHAQGVAGWGLTGFSNIDDLSNNIVKVAAGGYHTVALKNDGTVACWGNNNSGQCNTPANLGPVTAIAAGYYHTVALKNDGTVACWGDNNYGQCNTPANLGHRHRNRRGRQSHPRDPHRRKRQPPLRHELRHPRCWHPRRSERRHAARRAIRGG